MTRQMLYHLADVLQIRFEIAHKKLSGAGERRLDFGDLHLNAAIRTVSAVMSENGAAVVITVLGDVGVFLNLEIDGPVPAYDCAVLDLSKLPERGKKVLEKTDGSTAPFEAVKHAAVERYSRRGRQAWKAAAC